MNYVAGDRTPLVFACYSRKTGQPRPFEVGETAWVAWSVGDEEPRIREASITNRATGKVLFRPTSDDFRPGRVLLELKIKDAFGRYQTNFNTFEILVRSAVAT